jgi:CheY-like chemotaxis protein
VPNILVADDNTNIQKMVALALEERGIHVVSVGNGEAAVRRIPDVNPDLVLADIFMPVRNGYEVCEFVKKDQRFAHIPVILLVGAFDPLDEKEARRVGADGVLKKPFVPPDPLIAMVMSALEKNPRIAAELAKAKEAKAVVVVEPPSVAELEIPARMEPKPLPQFPDPSPEEAALVYGFGTGRRELEDDDKQAGAAKEPKAPVAEAEEAGEDEFDGASTSHDWRRTAMDFEVPAEAANKPAFSSVEELNRVTFPSERDVPPRRVRVPDPSEEIELQAQDSAPAFAEAEPPGPAIVEAPAGHKAPEPVLAAREAAPEFEKVSSVESAPDSEPSFASGAAHWMDAVAPPTSENPTGGWMAALTGEHVEAKAADESIAPPLPSAQPVSQPSSEEPFFADDAAADESPFGFVPPAIGTAHGTASDPIARAALKTDHEIEFEPEDAEPPLAFKDPNLVQPPAVHVTPEPLLLEEEPHGPSNYGARPQETAPLHSNFSPASGDPVLEGPAAEESPEHAEDEASSWEPSSREVDERIPTMPPPNREALADIPFLMPPPAVSHADEGGGTAVDSSTVDAVVRKVLEKLEPQLHDLLSQGVLKPLVENLLQSELAKKEK